MKTKYRVTLVLEVEHTVELPPVLSEIAEALEDALETYEDRLAEVGVSDEFALAVKGVEES